MGSWIAADFVLTGHFVRFTVSPRTSREDALRRVAGAACNRHVDRLAYAANVFDAAHGADLVVEALPEDLALKRQALCAAQEAAPDAILATNTSSLRIADIGAPLSDPSRLLGIHYVNPPWAFRVVEVVTSTHTDPAVVARVDALLASQDRIPIKLMCDIPGFVFNRLQFALLREALHLVTEGVLSTADVDRIVVHGLGRRLALAGPLTTAALGGADLFAALARRLYPELCSADAPPPDFGSFLPAKSHLEQARRVRDAGLAGGGDVPGHWQFTTTTATPALGQ